MEDDTKSRLAGLSANHEKKLAAGQQRKREVEDARTSYLAKFGQLRDQILRPALEELVAEMANYGHYCKITERDITHESDGRRLAPNIRLELRPKGWDFTGYSPSSDVPAITIYCNETKKKIHFHEATMGPGREGHAKGTGDYNLEEVTSALVEEKFLALVEQVLGS